MFGCERCFAVPRQHVIFYQLLVFSWAAPSNDQHRLHSGDHSRNLNSKKTTVRLAIFCLTPGPFCMLYCHFGFAQVNSEGPPLYNFNWIAEKMLWNYFSVYGGQSTPPKMPVAQGVGDETRGNQSSKRSTHTMLQYHLDQLEKSKNHVQCDCSFTG